MCRFKKSLSLKLVLSPLPLTEVESLIGEGELPWLPAAPLPPCSSQSGAIARGDLDTGVNFQAFYFHASVFPDTHEMPDLRCLSEARSRLRSPCVPANVGNGKPFPAMAGGGGRTPVVGRGASGAPLPWSSGLQWSFKINYARLYFPQVFAVRAFTCCIFLWLAK